MGKQLKKFIPFAKVDVAKRQVWGIVTAERPDKDDEVCDYDKSKPFYQALIAEMQKASGGENCFPLREMHGLSAAGKGIGFEFRDDDKEIFMGFEVVDDVAWEKVQKNVYTGFSQGGHIVGDREPDPKFAGCMRYVAAPSECSLVDNPCLPDAHFAYVKADGSVELRKYSKTESPAHIARISSLEKDVALLKKAATSKSSVTKAVCGEDLPASAFLIVGHAEKPDTWQLPIAFADTNLTKRHIRNALVKFNSVSKDEAAWKRLLKLAEQSQVDVTAERQKMASILNELRKRARVAVNRMTRTAKVDLGHALYFLDNDLGRLQKGMYEVSRLAEYIQNLAWMVYSVASEQEYEEDSESPVPTMIASNVDDLITTLVAMVAEEAAELRTEVESRVH